VSPTYADFVLPWKLAETERETGHHPTLELTAVNSAAAIRMITDASVELAIVALGAAETLPDHDPAAVAQLGGHAQSVVGAC
jgi:hypothetical protein